MASPRQLVTLAQAADILCLDEKTLRRYVSTGRLQGFRVGPRAVRVDAAEVESLAQPILTAAAS